MVLTSLVLLLLCCIFQADCCTKTTFHNTVIAIARTYTEDLTVRVTVSGCITPEIIAQQLGQGDVIRVLIANQTVPIFHEKAVTNLLKLEQLVIENSFIKRIKQNAFFNLPQLRSLLINGNHINIIDRNAFLNLDLHTIHLSGNKIEYLEPGIFANLSRLMYLELKYNDLEAFEPEWFTNSFKLEMVDISHNRMRTVQRNTFEPFKQLQNIDLSYNQIKHIHKNALEGLGNLQFLYLHNNRIEKLEPTLFRSLHNLTVLWMHGNNLTYISDSNLQDLSRSTMEEATIHTNPWQCACYEKIIEWANKCSIYFNHETLCFDKNIPVCVVPKHNDQLCLEVWEEDLYDVFYKFSDNYYTCIAEHE